MPKRYREYMLPMLLFALSALLTLMLVWQWLHYRNLTADLKSRLAMKEEIRLEAPAVDEAPYKLPGLDEYTAMVERPLFVEGRRPVAEAAPEIVSTEKSKLKAKLMGIVASPNGVVGLFVDEKGKYKRLRVNDSIGDWKVAEFAAGKAVMEQDGSREELKVVKPKDKKTGAAPVPPGVPGQVPGQPLPQPSGDGRNPAIPESPADSEAPNDAIDETAEPSEEGSNE